MINIIVTALTHWLLTSMAFGLFFGLLCFVRSFQASSNSCCNLQFQKTISVEVRQIGNRFAEFKTTKCLKCNRTKTQYDLLPDGKEITLFDRRPPYEKGNPLGNYQ